MRRNANTRGSLALLLLLSGTWNLAPAQLQNTDHAKKATGRLENAANRGMYQLGGRYWREFFPKLVPILLAAQQPDGSWPADNHRVDGRFGSAYTTALVVITLGAPNQLLPVFQR